jgi:hypothetical protein
MVPSYNKHLYFDLFGDLETDLVLDLFIELLGHKASGSGVSPHIVHNGEHLVILQQVALDHISELTEPFVIQSHSPVLTQELSNVGDQPTVQSHSHLIQVLFAQANKRHNRLHIDVFIRQISDAVDDPVVVETETDVLTLPVHDVI